MSCPCDLHIFPLARRLPSGLGGGVFQLARALGTFPDWRLSTLAAIGADKTLDDWRAREAHDLGLMLVEMGAYVFDVCDFYAALVSGETYLKTARLDGAQRKLVELLGYLPRPAVGAEAYLAAEVDGRRVIDLPKGVAFSSGSFDGHPPQIFELTSPLAVDPRVNRLAVARVLHDAVPATLAGVLVEPSSLRARAGDPIVLDCGGTLRPARIARIDAAPLRGRLPAAHVVFTAAVSVPDGARYSTLRILGSGGTRGLWKLGQIGTDTETAVSGSDVILESLANIRPADIVLFERHGSLEARRVTATIERQRVLFASLTSTITDTGGTATGSVVSPPITVAVSRLSLDEALTWPHTDADKIVVHHPLSDAARAVIPSSDILRQTDPILLPDLVDPPRAPVSHLLLEDVHHEGVSTAGSIDAGTKTAQPAQGQDWGRTLTAAVTLFGNVLPVSRGETVAGELLGTGDGALASQVFKLKKKPLTYLNAPTARGYRSTLEVRVNGVRWREVDSFYGATDSDQVYIVRHDEQGETFVHVGGGARLTTAATVTADYRYGAGAAVPPAASIAQIVRPVPGLNSVRNILPAFGGGDAESPRELLVYAPRSALLLGRAVSLPDLEAAAATVSGVRAARASWRWDDAGLRAVAEVLFIGSEQLIPVIRGKLRALTEPDAPIRVVRATPQLARMILAVEIHPDHVPGDVIAGVHDALYRRPDLPGTGGLLRPERLGPEGVIFLSDVAASVMAVSGVVDITSASFDAQPFVQSGRKALPGRYFDFGEPGTSSGGLVINGVA